MSDHILTTFDRELINLREKILTMISIARKNLDAAMRGLLERDADLCNEAIAADQDVNELEKEVDQIGMQALIRFQPAAHDLREIMGTIRIANNVERIADQAASIAKRARWINQLPEMPELKQIQPLFQLCLTNLDACFDSLRAGDPAEAEAARLLDRQLDAAEKDFDKLMLEVMSSRSHSIEVCLHLIFIARFLERVGDHGKNICEDTIFIEQAKDVRFTKKRRQDESR